MISKPPEVDGHTQPQKKRQIHNAVTDSEGFGKGLAPEAGYAWFAGI